MISSSNSDDNFTPSFTSAPLETLHMQLGSLVDEVNAFFAREMKNQAASAFADFTGRLERVTTMTMANFFAKERKSPYTLHEIYFQPLVRHLRGQLDGLVMKVAEECRQKVSSQTETLLDRFGSEILEQCVFLQLGQQQLTGTNKRKNNPSSSPEVIEIKDDDDEEEEKEIEAKKIKTNNNQFNLSSTAPANLPQPPDVPQPFSDFSPLDFLDVQFEDDHSTTSSPSKEPPPQSTRKCKPKTKKKRANREANFDYKFVSSFRSIEEARVLIAEYGEYMYKSKLPYSGGTKMMYLCKAYSKCPSRLYILLPKDDFTSSKSNSNSTPQQKCSIYKTSHEHFHPFGQVDDDSEIYSSTSSSKSHKLPKTIFTEAVQAAIRELFFARSKRSSTSPAFYKSFSRKLVNKYPHLQPQPTANQIKVYVSNLQKVDRNFQNNIQNNQHS